jgi:hypothetical protein
VVDELKRIWKERSYSDLRHHPYFCPRGVRWFMETRVIYSLDVNPGLPEYAVGAPSTQQDLQKVGKKRHTFR